MNTFRALFLSILLLVIKTGALATNNNDTLSVRLKNQPLKTFLKIVEQKTNYSFVFSNDEIDITQKVSVDIKTAPLLSVLEHGLKPLSISYQIIGSQIILKQTSGKVPKNQKKISGFVFNEKDSIPLPGVNVFLKDTLLGTITNNKGYFELEIPLSSEALFFSYVGYETVSLRIGSQKKIQVLLKEDQRLLGEVVVLGYGEENLKLLSSAVSKISNQGLNLSFTSGLSESIKGKLTGVYVNQNSGTPGAAKTLRIRGVSSITAGANPLIIVDGVPIINHDLSQIYFNGQSVSTLSEINMADVEQISILKDASATAIYGARGSNGVVLITTKRGSEQNQITFNAKYGLQKASNLYNMLNSRQYMQYKNNAAMNDGAPPIYSDQEMDQATDTDWQKKLYRVAPIRSYNLSFSGGSKDSKYYLMSSYFNEKGTVMGTGYTRLSSRLNLDHKFSDCLSIGAGLVISRSVNQRKEGDQSLNGPVPMAISQPPIYPLYNNDGSFNDDGPFANPISIATHHKNMAYTWHTLGNVFGEYKITKNLDYTLKVGLDYINFREHSYDPAITRQGAKYQGLGLESTSEAIKTVVSNVINYKLPIENNHSLEFLLGYEIDNEQISSTFMRGELFPSQELEYLVSSAEKISADAMFRESVLNSYFGRIKYNFKNKYLGSFNARYDGSSRFSQNNRYGFFPSGDLAWRVSEEKFFNLASINEFKLRASYGITGNDKIPDFLYISRFGTAEYNNASAIYPVNISNASLKWETTNQLNIGTDVTVLNERLTITFDVYRKKTKDLLLEKPLPPSAGFTGIISNIGKLENKGLEIGVQSVNLDRQIKWRSHFSLSLNKNKVTHLYQHHPIENIGRGFQRIQEGEPIGVFYGYESLGVDPSTGDLIWADLNNDGIIDVNDRKKIGSPHPIFQGGLWNELTWRNFDFDIFIQFSYGNEVFNGTRRYIETMKDNNNQTINTLNRWKEPGDITNIPRATNADPNQNDRVSSRFVEDGSFIKFRTIKLSYSLPPIKIKRMKIKQANIFLLAQNMFTLTPYSGMDPEVNYAGADFIRSGVEFFTYPPAKIISAGVSIKF